MNANAKIRKHLPLNGRLAMEAIQMYKRYRKCGYGRRYAYLNGLFHAQHLATMLMGKPKS